MPTFPTPRIVYFGEPATPGHEPDKNDVVQLLDDMQVDASTAIAASESAGVDADRAGVDADRAEDARDLSETYAGVVSRATSLGGLTDPTTLNIGDSGYVSGSGDPNENGVYEVQDNAGNEWVRIGDTGIAGKLAVREYRHTTRIGVPDVPASGIANNDATFVFTKPVSVASRAKRLDVYMLSSGTVYLKRFAEEGNNWYQVGDDYPLSLPAGLNTVTGASIEGFVLQPGEIVGFYSGGSIGHLTNAEATNYYKRAGNSRWVQKSTETSGTGLEIALTFESVASFESVSLDELTSLRETVASLRQTVSSMLPASESIFELAKSDGWFAFYDPASATLESSGKISSVPDRFGNLPSVEQGTSNNQPTYVANMTSYSGGTLPGMLFDGSDDQLLSVAVSENADQPLFILAAAWNDARSFPDDTRMIVDGINEGDNRNALYAQNLDAIFIVNAFAGAAFVSQTDGNNIRVPRGGYTHGALFIDDVSQIHISGEKRSPRDIGAHNLTGVRVGGRSTGGGFWEGKIGPVLIYRGIPSDAVVSRMEDRLLDLMGVRPTYIEFPYIERAGQDVGATQGVARSSSYFFTTATADNLTIRTYDTSWAIQHTFDATGLVAGQEQVNGLHYDEVAGKLYSSANNFPTTPSQGWIFEFDVATNGSLTHVATHDVGAYWSEGAAPWDGSWWVVYHNLQGVRQYDTNWNFVAEHTLPVQPPEVSGTKTLYQDIGFSNGVAYLNLHGSSVSGPRMLAFEWNGSGFDTVDDNIMPPTSDCAQGFFFDADGDHVWWAERVNNFSQSPANVVKSSILIT